MNLYDLNKQIFKGVKELTSEEKSAAKTIVKEFVKSQSKKNIKYWMLLCRERADYTLFDFIRKDNLDFFGNEFLETIENRGKVKSIEKDNYAGTHIEIWINVEGEDHCYMFFPYDEGVIQI